MDVPSSARAQANASALRANYRRTRARLMTPQPDRTASDPPSVAAAPRSAQSLPPELSALVDTVAAATGLNATQLRWDMLDEKAISARKVASALLVRCFSFSRAAAADALGMPEPAVRAALRRVDRILNLRAAPAGADLADTVRTVLADWPLDAPSALGLADIKRAVAAAFGLGRGELESPMRHQPLVAARQLAMALARHLGRRSYPEIGRHFGGRDHTTVIHAVRKMAPLLANAAQVLRSDADIDGWVRAACAQMDVPGVSEKAAPLRRATRRRGAA